MNLSKQIISLVIAFVLVMSSVAAAGQPTVIASAGSFLEFGPGVRARKCVLIKDTSSMNGQPAEVSLTFSYDEGAKMQYRILNANNQWVAAFHLNGNTLSHQSVNGNANIGTLTPGAEYTLKVTCNTFINNTVNVYLNEELVVENQAFAVNEAIAPKYIELLNLDDSEKIRVFALKANTSSYFLTELANEGNAPEDISYREKDASAEGWTRSEYSTGMPVIVSPATEPQISLVGAGLTKASDNTAVFNVQKETVNYKISLKNHGTAGTAYVTIGVFENNTLIHVVNRQQAIGAGTRMDITGQLPAFGNADQLTTRIMVWDTALKPLSAIDKANTLVKSSAFDRYKVYFSQQTFSAYDDKYEFTPASGVVEIGMTVLSATDITLYNAKRKAVLFLPGAEYAAHLNGESRVMLLVDTDADCYDLYVDDMLIKGAQRLHGAGSDSLTDNIAAIAAGNAASLRSVNVALADRVLSGIVSSDNPSYAYSFASGLPSEFSVVGSGTTVTDGYLQLNTIGQQTGVQLNLPKTIDGVTEVSFRFRINAKNKEYRFFINTTNNRANIWLRLQGQKLVYTDNDNVAHTVTDALSLAQWHTFKMIADISRSSMDLYIDGDRVAKDVTGRSPYFSNIDYMEIITSDGKIDIDDLVIRESVECDVPQGYADAADAPEFKDVAVAALPVGKVYYASDMMLGNCKVISTAQAVKGSAVQILGTGAGRASFVFDGNSGYYKINVGYIESDAVADSSYRVYHGAQELDFWYGKYDDGGRHVRSVSVCEYMEKGDVIHLEGYSSGDGSVFDYIEFVETQKVSSQKGIYIDDEYWNNAGDKPTSWQVSGPDCRIDGDDSDKCFKLTAESGRAPARAVRHFKQAAGSNMIFDIVLKGSTSFQAGKIMLGTADGDAAVIHIQGTAIYCDGLNLGYPSGGWKGIRLVLNTAAKTYSVYAGTKSKTNIPFADNVAYLDRLIVDTGTVNVAESNLYIKSVKLSNGYVCDDDFKIYSGDTSDVVPWGWSAVANGGEVKAVRSEAEMLDQISLMLKDTSTLSGVKATRAFAALDDKVTATFHMLLQDGLTATLGDVAITTSNGNIYVNNTLAWDNYKRGIWYRFCIEEDLASKTAKVYINHIEKAILSNSGAAVSEISFATGNRETMTVYVDDVCIEDTIYVSPIPEPMAVDTGDFDIGMQACDIWREGTHFGWDKLRPYDMMTPVGGYYDDGSRPQADLEIKWLTEHGISVYMPCWFKSATNTKTHLYGDKLDAFLSSPYINKMKFAIVWENTGGISSADEMMNYILPYWIEHYFRHPSYYMVDGNKPLITIYLADKLKSNLKNAENVKSLFENIEAKLIEEGFGGAVFNTNSRSSKYVHTELKNSGYDYTYVYSFRDRSMEAQIDIQERINAYGTLDAIPVISQGWGDEPWGNGFRKKNISLAQWYGGLRYFKEHYMPAREASSLASKLIMLDNWNEWGEGHVLYPSNFAGFSYLDAVREVFAKDSGAHTEYVPVLESDLYIH